MDKRDVEEFIERKEKTDPSGGACLGTAGGRMDETRVFFCRNRIPYKYECPLYLKGVGTVYPDFTFLSLKTGQEIYWKNV